MLGQMIGITTSIATIAATGLARGGAAALTGAGRRQVPVRRVVIRKNADVAIAKLVAALEAERNLRGQLERENARMAEKIEAAEEVIEILMQERAA